MLTITPTFYASFDPLRKIRKLIKRIPNWLKDGFVDAHEFLAQLDAYGTDASVPAGINITEPLMSLDQHDTGRSHEQSEQTVLPDSYKAIHGLSPSLDIEKYKIIRQLGRGGMGVVYLAEDKALKRYVALKVIESHVSNLPGFHERFLREGRIVAALHHPNIVQIYSMDQLPTGQIVLVTEYIEGENLNDVIRNKGKLPLPQAIWISLSVAKALDAAHKKQIIHRDVKPNNIILTNEDEVKLLDFGIAKFKQESSAEITGEGAIIGTPAFMSPEQMRGESLDARTDLYSLGVVFYELVTGKLPFEGSSIHDLIFKAITEAPPLPTSLNPEITPEVESIILKCLEKDREKRFSSAKELIWNLEHLLYKQEHSTS